MMVFGSGVSSRWTHLISRFLDPKLSLVVRIVVDDLLASISTSVLPLAAAAATAGVLVSTMMSLLLVSPALFAMLVPVPRRGLFAVILASLLVLSTRVLLLLVF